LNKIEGQIISAYATCSDFPWQELLPGNLK
jgi:hypothetical protein